MYVRKSGVGCAFYSCFSCFFVTVVYIIQSHYNFSVFFTFLGHVAMQGIECDLLVLVCGLYVSVGYNREPYKSG